MFTCPACHEPLISCLECDAKVTCSNPACLATHFADCEQCFEHHRAVCYECLKRNDTVAPLICCPTCQNWCCMEDSYWCAGLVIQPALGSQELAQLSHECDWDHETIVRSHPPKPTSCKVCNGHDFPPQGWRICPISRNPIHQPNPCPSQTPFMTDHGLRAAYCPDCLESRPGHFCACKLRWLCNVCIAVGNRSIEYPFFITCPRCGVSYCTGLGSACADTIDFCGGCKGAILCNNCQEEEELPREIQNQQELSKQVVFVEQCGLCDAWTCADCRGSEGTTRCFHCGAWFCRRCLFDSDDSHFEYTVQLCFFCADPICLQCRRENRIEACTGAHTMVSVGMYDCV